MKRLLQLMAMLFQRLFGEPLQHESDRLKAVRDIAANNETSAILPLSQFLMDESPLVRQAAANELGHLVARCRPEELVQLDREMRYYCGWHGCPEWHRFRKQDVDDLPIPETTHASVLGLVSFHWNGHVRERAVQLLDAVEDGSEIPFLLIRLNDWVDAVRETARLAVERRLCGDAFDPFFSNIAFVVRLLEQKRVDHGPLVQTVVQGLVKPEHQGALTGMVQSNNRNVRRPVFHAAMQLPGPHRLRLVSVCTESPDPVIRLSCVRLAPSIFTLEGLAAFLRRLEDDPFMPVRREVLRARVKSVPEESESAVHAALFDRSPAIREEARYHLLRRGQQDFADMYRNAIRNGFRLDRAIAGIGDTGDVADTERVCPFLQSSLISLRVAAITAIGRLGADIHVEPLFERLTDESPRVVRAAANALKGCAAAIGKERLWKLFCTHHTAHVRMAALRLLDGLGSWDKLPYMIQAAADSDMRIAERAMSSASRVCTRVFTRPSVQQQIAIEECMRVMTGRLPASFDARLRNWLK